MIRRLAPSAGLIALTLLPGVAQAQRGRGGPVMSPFGEVYNTNSPEYRMSGGNPEVLEQLLEQKMMMQQMQQQMAYEKQMQDYFKKNPQAKKQYEDRMKKMMAAQQAKPKAKKKKKATSAASIAAPKATATLKAVENDDEDLATAEAPSTKPATSTAKPSLATVRGKP